MRTQTMPRNRTVQQNRRFGRRPAPAPTKGKSGMGKGMLMAALPVVGGLVAKKMRGRRGPTM